MLREVTVFLYEKPIGKLYQTDDEFIFEYNEAYYGVPLSLSFPLTQRVFRSKTLFPYFVSLAPEGWLKARFAELQKLDEKDLLGLLIQNGQNLIGAVRLESKK